MGKKAKKSVSPFSCAEDTLALFDADSNGSVSLEEFLQVTSSFGIPDKDAKNVFNRFDGSRTGVLNKDQLLDFATKGAGVLQQLVCKAAASNDHDDSLIAAFKKFDKDGNGTISREELLDIFMVLNPSFTKKELNNAWEAMPKEGNGEISFEEFVSWLRNKK
eukprot:TRINITY_DN10162_c0_g1_i1.p1 TRINITY_DN10162_c0_g1~~TRINITY_DN10162_c0_g1_i1.p1  ORF type:complete len:174 (-),score=50.78 TRINITY_DN10162_c0_g1_i1:300-785(-)